MDSYWLWGVASDSRLRTCPSTESWKSCKAANVLFGLFRLVNTCICAYVFHHTSPLVKKLNVYNWC